MIINLYEGCSLLPAAYETFSQAAKVSYEISQARRSLISLISTTDDLKQAEILQGKLDQAAAHAASVFTDTYRREAAKGSFEIFKAHDLLSLEYFLDFSSLILEGPNPKQAMRSFWENSLPDFNRLIAAVRFFAASMDEEMFSDTWKSCKRHLGMDLNPPRIHPNGLLPWHVLRNLAQVENIAKRDLFEIASLLIALDDFVDYEYDRRFSSTSVAKFDLEAPPLLVSEFNPSFYRLELTKRKIDPQAAAVLLPAWPGDFDSFLTGASSLSSD